MSDETIAQFERALMAVAQSALIASEAECHGGCTAGDLLMVAAVRAYALQDGRDRNEAFMSHWLTYAREVMFDEEFGGMAYGGTD